MVEKLTAEMKRQLRSMLAADLGRSDITSHVVPEQSSKARIVSKQPCIAVGLEEACYLFTLKHVKCVKKAKEGRPVRANAAVLELRGSNRAIFNVERTALNIISRMSAVATACNQAQELAGKKAKVAITRKTMPGFNLFDNRAASIGGVWTHRINLNSFVLLKDNHLLFFERPSHAVLAARAAYGNKMKVEIEVDSMKQALDAITAKPNILMLDNFTPAKAKSTIRKLRKKGFSGKVELSGGISMHNLKKYAGTGADIISLGSLTHSVSSKDFSLEMI